MIFSLHLVPKSGILKSIVGRYLRQHIIFSRLILKIIGSSGISVGMIFAKPNFTHREHRVLGVSLCSLRPLW